MNRIVRKEQFSEKVFLFEIEAPLIAKSRKAGNFVIVRVGKKGERMPLTIAAADIEKGTITLVVQKVGLSSQKLCMLEVGEYVTDVVGPLGNPTKIEQYGTVVCAGGGLGVAPMLPIIQALKAAGNRVLSVMAGRSKDGGPLQLLRRESMSKGVDVAINDDDSLSLDLHIGVDYDVNIVAVCRSIMNEVSYKVEKWTSMKVKNVDVYVDTVIVDKEKKEK